jgi:hypothetical protein
VPDNSKFPRRLICNQCGETAIVKAYLPTYAEQKNEAALEQVLKALTCIIDCSNCGVRNQNVTRIPS